jgi:hypothetical protein
MQEKSHELDIPAAYDLLLHQTLAAWLQAQLCKGLGCSISRHKLRNLHCQALGILRMSVHGHLCS